MFETAEIGHRLSKSDFDAMEPQLRLDLVEVQQALRRADFPVIMVFGGVDGAGKGEVVKQLNTWMDTRWIDVLAYRSPSDEARERPEFWRYWRDLPPQGRIGMFLSAWYSRPLLQWVYGESDDAAFEADLARILRFERALADDGALILKFWMHLDKNAQQKRLKALQKDPLESWRVDKAAWRNWKRYDRFQTAAERIILRTSRGDAPWSIVEGRDRRYRFVEVATALRDAIRLRLDNHRPPPVHDVEVDDTGATPVLPGQPTILRSLPMDVSLEHGLYKRRLKQQQARLHHLFQRAKASGRSSVLVFEGWDAAGKGGAIARVAAALDPRDYNVVQTAAPTDEERSHHYLWRFWRHMTRAGRLLIFDRSWYGRVLVERVEGFARPEEWGRAYAEIRDFEEHLVRHGTILVKYWMHITPEEQLRRFEERQERPWKQWKLTDEDWRNRNRWDAYELAFDDLVQRTSTSVAPWQIIPSNDKKVARVEVISRYADALERALEG